MPIRLDMAGTGHGRQPGKIAADAAYNAAWRRDTGTPHADLRISAVSVVPAGDHLAYQGSTTGDTASTTVDIPRIILAVSGTHEHR